MSLTMIGVLGVIALVVLLVCSLPVAISMAVVGVVGCALIISFKSALALLSADLYDVFANYNLTVIPLFVFMGQVAFHSGISRRLFAAANSWLSGLRGGLAMATVGACAAFGAICGSGPATAATMAAVALPEMRRYKYDDALASGTVAAGGGLGMLIPPSVVFIVYGILTEQSIGKLFMSGVIPGILVAVLFCVVISVQCWLNPRLAPPATSVPWRERFRKLGGVIETLILFVFVMGGMFAGWFTATEAAAMGAAGSVAIAVAGRNVSVAKLWQAAQETVRTSCMVMVIVAGATVFGHFLALTGMPTQFAGWLAHLPVPSTVIIILILFFYLAAGALSIRWRWFCSRFDLLSGGDRMGYDPIWFGVIIVLVTQMGVITPPVGSMCIVSGIDRSLSLQTVFRGAMPFLLALAVACVLLMVFPQLATWLPSVLD